MSGSTATPPPQPNPFSPMAVAKITRFDESDWVDLTIETDAIRQATAYLSGYLDAAPPGPGQGRAGEVIAVIGDYGTGKTHLATELVRRARRVLEDPAQVMYIDATAGSFVELHRRFMGKLGLAGVRNQVSDYYADIVADSLQDVGLGSDVIEWLRNRELVPQHVVERLGLMESALLRKVQQTLRRVTDNRDVGTALALLLRTGFDEVVWSWLTGGQPDEVLVERGITRPIDNEVAALDAMGIFAMLYGGRRAQFVLVIDELDKILSGANQPEADIVAAFEKLLEVFANAGACLVVCGLPEARGVLRPSTRQRVSRTVEMTVLSVDEVCSFIKRAQQVKLGRDDLAPFTRDSVRYLRDIAGGNARKVIRLCHDVFRIVDDRIRQTGDQNTLVTDQMVREAESIQFGSPSADDIHSAVRGILDANGWTYQHNHFLRALDEGSRVDFWVTFIDRNGGCAVLITESVLNANDTQTVAGRIFAVRDAAPNSQVILIINGVLAEVYAAQVGEALEVEPLRYVEHGFANRFTAQVEATSSRLSQVVDTDPLTVVRQRMEQINRQQSSIYDNIGQLADRLDEVRGASDRRLAVIQRDLAVLTRAERDTARSTIVGGVGPAGLPSEVDRLLLGAVEALDELTQVDVMMADAFGDPGRTGEAVQRRLNSADLVKAVGVASLIRAAVLAFRSAATTWYRVEIIGVPGPPSPAAVARLDALCRAYDDVVEFLPLFELRPLVQLPWTGGPGTEASQSVLRDRVEAAVGNLSPRVQRSLVRSSVPGGR